MGFPEFRENSENVNLPNVETHPMSEQTFH